MTTFALDDEVEVLDTVAHYGAMRGRVVGFAGLMCQGAVYVDFGLGPLRVSTGWECSPRTGWKSVEKFSDVPGVPFDPHEIVKV